MQFKEKSLHTIPADMVCLKSRKIVYEFVFKRVDFLNFIYLLHLVFIFDPLCTIAIDRHSAVGSLNIGLIDFFAKEIF